MFRLLLLTVTLVCISLGGVAEGSDIKQPTWKAGLARVDITPAKPVVLLGYGDRKGPFTAVAQPIFAKALALEDADGHRGIIVTADLVGFQAAVLTNPVAARVQEATGLQRSQLLFNASHSHTGPLVSTDPWREANPVAHAPLSPEDAAETVAYTKELQDKLVTLVEAALIDLAPAALAYGAGAVDFPMSRRLPQDGQVVMADSPAGAVDRSVPVMVVRGLDGSARALLFGCACHNTALTGADNVIAGDYAGFAQAQLEQEQPGVQAMFMSGCGGDANPSPRGSMDLAVAHGGALAAEVRRVAAGTLLELPGVLETHFEEIDLPLQVLT